MLLLSSGGAKYMPDGSAPGRSTWMTASRAWCAPGFSLCLVYTSLIMTIIWLKMREKLALPLPRPPSFLEDMLRCDRALYLPTCLMPQCGVPPEAKLRVLLNCLGAVCKFLVVMPILEEALCKNG